MENLERTLNANSLAVPAIFLALGIFISSYVGNGVVWGFVLILIAIVIYLCVINLSKDPLRAYKIRGLHYLWLAVAFLGTGILFSSMDKPDFVNEDNLTAKSVSGIVTDISEKASGDVITLDVDKIRWSSGNIDNFSNLKLIVKCVGSDTSCSVGDNIEFPATLQIIEDNPNSFASGYRRIMNSKGIYYDCNVYDGNIKILGHHFSLMSLSRQIRNILEMHIENTRLSKSTQHFLITVLLGDRTYLDSSTREIFADAGVAHVLALSGMHMAIIGGIFLCFLFPFNFAGKYKVRYLLTATMLWLYACITGMAPSTVRACVMVTFATMAIILERKRYVFNSLFAAVLIILLFSPSTLYDIGFQLSFVCVASLAAFAPHFNPFSHKDSPQLYRIASLFSATIVATAGSWIITAYYFESFPLSFIPANIILLPVLPVCVCLALIYLLLIRCGIESQIFGHILDSTFNIMRDVMEWIGAGNSISVNIGINAVIAWITGLILIGLFLNVNRWKPLMYSGISLILLSLTIILLQADNIRDGSFIITNNYHKVAINIKDGNQEHLIFMKKGEISQIRIENSTIIAIDRNIPEITASCNCDYLIIAGGFKGDITEACRVFKPMTIVIHPSVRRKRERNFLIIARKNGTLCHSIRLDKPLKVLI